MAIGVYEENFTPGGDFADMRDARFSSACGGVKKAYRFGRSGKEKSIVFAAVKREFQRSKIFGEQFVRELDFWQLVSPKTRANPARLAEPCEIRGEAVGNVHHRGRNLPTGEKLGKCDGNSRKKMRSEEFF